MKNKYFLRYKLFDFINPSNEKKMVLVDKNQIDALYESDWFNNDKKYQMTVINLKSGLNLSLNEKFNYVKQSILS